MRLINIKYNEYEYFRKRKIIIMKQLTNKVFTVISSFFLVAIFTSCTPSIQYLGDSYKSTNQIDVFYDEKDVQKEYKTIGKMTHGNMFDYEVETIKNKMIEIAKKKGGDGIIFLDMQNVREHEHLDDILDDDRISIIAQVIRYK